MARTNAPEPNLVRLQVRGIRTVGSVELMPEVRQGADIGMC